LKLQKSIPTMTCQIYQHITPLIWQQLFGSRCIRRNSTYTTNTTNVRLTRLQMVSVQFGTVLYCNKIVVKSTLELIWKSGPPIHDFD
jgi:hypothetical protein